MFCGNCGGKLIDNEKFCPGCGEKIRVENSGDAAQPALIEEADRIFVYQFLYPIIIILSILPSFSKDEFDKFDYLGGILGGFVEIAILHFIIFYLWGRLKNTVLLTLAIGLNMLIAITQIGITILDLDRFTHLGAAALRLETDDYASMKLVSIFDYFGFVLLIVEIGVLLYLRNRFLQKKGSGSNA